ncbi:hypothetical protein FF38_06768 [Lucilia cuprina]|uniref:Uncharacterized protein n=1 Tax=Lucilia cuprina TaxID=7375 RepID=A0A0L0CRF2_LUCCU|nr:hypothetical protein FF38_06768 [Lucilia cuprina]
MEAFKMCSFISWGSHDCDANSFSKVSWIARLWPDAAIITKEHDIIVMNNHPCKIDPIDSILHYIWYVRCLRHDASCKPETENVGRIPNGPLGLRVDVYIDIQPFKTKLDRPLSFQIHKNKIRENEITATTTTTKIIQITLGKNKNKKSMISGYIFSYKYYNCDDDAKKTSFSELFLYVYGSPKTTWVKYHSSCVVVASRSR